MRLNRWFSVLVVLLSLVASGVSLAQLSALDRTSTFREDIVRTGDPVMETICHIPPGNPSNVHTIDVEQQDLAAHLSHGDVMGECPYECDGPPSAVPQTGQTASWGPRDDGELQMGVPSPDPRFTDNGDGTVTDNLTHLRWLRDANCFGQRNWTNALSEANALAYGDCGLMDGSVAGDWRLPNIKELQSLLDYGQIFPALPPGHPFSGVQSDNYWSSTTRANNSVIAWHVNFSGGGMLSIPKTNINYVWPVRGPV